MPTRLLILGGTADATALARAVAAAGIAATISLAGRVARPAPLPLPTRIGGFGGATGLADWLRRERISHVIDATHPFAAAISRNAAIACAGAGVPRLVLARPPWSPGNGDRWTRVADTDAAVAALAGPRRRVMLAVGRQSLDAFAANPQHAYLLRLVDPPAAAPPFPDHHVVVDRGPFTVAGDLALMVAHGIELVVSKNSGGAGARAKLDAARTLGLPVLMIDRPPPPPGETAQSIADAMAWLGHGDDAGTARGV